MTSRVQVKICGIKTPDVLEAAVYAGARFIGFVFYPPSPRHVEADTAKELSLMLPTGVRSVGLFVDPTDEQLDAVLGIVPLDMIQLHGSESVERIAEIRAKYAMPIIKAFCVSSAADIEVARAYEDVVDWLLFDGKSGGSGQSFDWSLLAGEALSKPIMLSGGLTPENVGEALSVLSPQAVDVSSGVESSRGVKDASKIADFIEAAKNS